MPQIIIKDKLFNYQIKRRSIRSVNIHLLTFRSFYVSCPRFTPEIIINRFIKKNQAWIINHSQKVVSYPKLKNTKDISILDRDYKVEFITSTTNKIILNHRDLLFSVFTNSLNQKNLKTLFEKYLRKLAKKLIEQEIFTSPFSLRSKVKSISVRNQKTRFGSCSGRGKLSFNWQIILFPHDKFRHIIYHELVHLDIKNHKKEFYLALSKLDPSWKANNKWLKTDAKKCFLVKP